MKKLYYVPMLLPAMFGTACESVMAPDAEQRDDDSLIETAATTRQQKSEAAAVDTINLTVTRCR